MDDLLPGMLHLSRDGGATLTRQLTDQLRELITRGHLAPGQRLPSSRQLAQSLALSRNTVSFAIEQLAAEGYLALSAGRRPVGGRGPVARPPQNFIAKQPRRKRADKPVGLGARPAPGELAARFMTDGRGRFSPGWRMNASFRTRYGAVACGARREMRRCAATGPSTIRRCRKPCSGISWFIAGSRPKPARS